MLNKIIINIVAGNAKHITINETLRESVFFKESVDKETGDIILLITDSEKKNKGITVTYDCDLEVVRNDIAKIQEAVNSL